MHMDTGGGNQDAYFHCTLSGTEVLELWQWPSLEAQASPAVQTARVLRVDSKVSIRRDLGSSPVDGEKSLHPQWKKRSSISIGVLQIFINYSLYYSLYSTNFPQYITIYRVGCWKLIALQAGQIQPNFRKVLRNVSGLVCPLCHEMLEELGMGSLRPATSQPNGL